MSAPPRIVAVSDGRAGNQRQANALATALAGMAVDHIVLQPRAPWRWLAPRRLPAAERAFGEGFTALLATPPEVVIGCGRQAALATRLLRQRGVHAVQILDPRIAPIHWDTVVVPEHDRLRGDNVLTLRGSLHPVDDEWLQAARVRFPTLGGHPSPRIALLVGGPGPHARLDDTEFLAALTALHTAVHASGGSVLATASRRTPAAWRHALRAQSRPGPDVVWCDDSDGTNPYAGLLAWADGIVCTADSVNMVSEACATRVPVQVIGVDGVDGGPRRFVDGLLADGRLSRFAGALALGEATPLRDTARIANQLRERLSR